MTVLHQSIFLKIELALYCSTGNCHSDWDVNFSAWFLVGRWCCHFFYINSIYIFYMLVFVPVFIAFYVHFWRHRFPHWHHFPPLFLDPVTPSLRRFLYVVLADHGWWEETAGCCSCLITLQHLVLCLVHAIKNRTKNTLRSYLII